MRDGDADVAVEMRDGELVAHYTQTDQVKAAIMQGALRAFVDGANVAATGQPPTYSLTTEAVEDDSLTTIQFVTPGLLGWAIAMSAAFGAAATLQGWRQTKLLRRLQLAPGLDPYRGRRPGGGRPWRSRWCRWRSSWGSVRPRSGSG